MKRSGKFMRVEGVVGGKWVVSYIKLDTEGEEENYYIVDGMTHTGSIQRSEFNQVLSQTIVEL